MVTNEINEEVYTNVLYSRVRVIHRKLKLYIRTWPTCIMNDGREIEVLVFAIMEENNRLSRSAKRKALTFDVVGWCSASQGAKYSSQDTTKWHQMIKEALDSSRR